MAHVEAAMRSFHVLAKPTGATCNLDCSYCFFLSKEMLYPGSRFRMSDDVLDTYIRQLVESEPGPVVNVAWQGGEPTLMGLPFFERSVELAEKHRQPWQRVNYTIQTNGTLIDEQWARFFKAKDFLVGISIDGPRPMHDAYRVDRGGQPTFDKVMRGLRHLRDAGVEYNVLTTIHHANADHPVDVYRFLRDECKARFVQFIPIIERLPESTEAWKSWHDRPLYTQVGAHVSERSVTAQQYGNFLCKVFDEWVRHDIGSVYVQMFDTALENWYRGESALCIHRRTCGGALAMEHNGDVYSCDHFVEPNYKLGNIAQTPLGELANSPRQQAFGESKESSLPGYCRSCDVRDVCNGGCPKDRFLETPDGEPGLNYLCEGYKMFFHHAAKPMAVMIDLLKQNRAPSEVMKLYRRRMLR